MKWKHVNRQTHRWVSILFTLVSASIFTALGLGVQPAQWVYYVPLAPLALLVLTGLTMFLLPYLSKRRAAVEIRA